MALTMCEHCGAPVERPIEVPKGRHVWKCCERCDRVIRGGVKNGNVFGIPVLQLPHPSTCYAGWISYRLAAQQVGFTLFSAKTRAERDHLHLRWNKVMGSIATLQANAGTLVYQETHVKTRLLEYWEDAFGIDKVSPETARWLLPRIVPDSQRHLLTGAPARHMLETIAGVPKRGALRHTQPDSLDRAKEGR